VTEDKTVQDVQMAYARAGEVKILQLAANYAIGLPVQPTIDLTPPSQKPLPVVAILAALADVQDPERSAQVKMLEAIQVEAEIVE